ncbi:MAG: hypothetical protein AB4911_11835 [Oscillochloridaceae bacterium umkhey_bin13]
MRQNQAPYSEIYQNEIHEDPTPPPAATGAQAGGDGGGLTATERYLLREGFSTRAAREFRDLDRGTVQADLERRRGLGQGIGAIVTTWRVEPPRGTTLDPAASQAINHRATSAKAQALAIAPPDANDIEIQYLALDMEEGLAPAQALTNLHERRAVACAGGGV